MVLRSNRISGSNGAVAVALAINDTPFVETYKFDRVSGWGTKYSAPGTIPGITGDGFVVTFSPDNDQLIAGGSVSALLYNYPFTYNDGYGTPVTIVYPNPIAAAIRQDQSKILISGGTLFAEFDYANGAVGDLLWGVSTTVGFQSAYFDNDKYFVVGFSSGQTFWTYDLSTTPPTRLSVSTFFGKAKQFSLSPQVLDDGSQAMAIPTDTGFRLYRFTDGVQGSQITESFPSAVQTAIFDPYGRLITYQASTARLRIYTQDGGGTLTELDTDTGVDGLGLGTLMQYDKDQDLLFIGGNNSPLVAAYQMGGGGFVSKYANPSVLPSSGVNKISLMYDERWKHFNT